MMTFQVRMFLHSKSITRVIELLTMDRPKHSSLRSPKIRQRCGIQCALSPCSYERTQPCSSIDRLLQRFPSWWPSVGCGAADGESDSESVSQTQPALGRSLPDT